MQVKRKLDLEHKAVLQPQPQQTQQILYTTFKAPSKVTAIKPKPPAVVHNRSRGQRPRSMPLPIAPATNPNMTVCKPVEPVKTGL